MSEIEALASELYAGLEWGGCDGARWERLTPEARDKWLAAARVITDPEWLAEYAAHQRAEALREAADAWTQGEWANHIVTASDPAQIRIGSANRFGQWLRDRADRLTGDA